MAGSIMTDVVKLYNFQQGQKGKPLLTVGGVVNNPAPRPRKPYKKSKS